MSILYDEGQQAIAEQARRVLAARASKDRLLALLEKQGEIDRPFWDTAIEQGWTGIALPEAYGGLGLGLVELGLVAQASGAATAGAPFLTTNYGAGLAILAGRDESAKAEWLPPIAAGERIGSGAVEKGVDLVANRRLKGKRGMRWWRERVDGLVALRVTLLNSDWDRDVGPALRPQQLPAF